MSVEITKEAVEKLTHNSLEIRLRAFEHIENRFVRALSHQLNIIFDATELCKQLLRWFKQPSCQKSKEVLHLLMRILKSTYGNDAIEKLGVERLKNEIKKIQNLTKGPQEVEIIQTIFEILHKYEKSPINYKVDGDLVGMVEKLSIASIDDGKTEIQKTDFPPGDFEIAWSKPPVADYNSLKIIADVLTSADTTPEEKDHTLQYLQIVMPDYPAEYMLQPPHLFLKILDISKSSQKSDKELQKKCFATLYSYVKVLKMSLFKRYKVENYAARKDSSATATKLDTSTGSQLKINVAIEFLLDKCLDELDDQAYNICKEVVSVLEIIEEILEISKILHLKIGDKFLLRLNQINIQLLNNFNRDDSKLIQRRTKYIFLVYMLTEMVEVNAKCLQLGDQYKLIAPQLIDFSLQINYPRLFDRIKGLVFSADITMEQSYKQIKKLKSEFEKAIQLLEQSDMNSSYIIVQASSILPFLNVLNSYKLTEMLFNALLEAIPLYLKEKEIKLHATILLYNLCQLQSTKLKSYVYQRICIAVKQHFAALMNHDNIYNNIPNQQLLSEQIIGVPFDLNIIQQIIQDNFEVGCPDIKKNAENILILLLKTYHFYQSSQKSFIETFSPMLPLLICCTHSNTIYDILLKLFDPDLKAFPFIDLLCGNIGFMFANDSTVRSEALTRLIYMLNSISRTSEYVPNIIEISDTLSNDLCLQSTSRELRQNFIVNESCYELSTLLNLLTILDTPDIDPQVRKSTLIQLNIMCRNWETVKAFCTEQAHYLVLAALENSLKKDSPTEYVENVIPTISILMKLLIYDNNFRNELAGVPNVYVLLLRALFNFSQDVQLRHDTSTCLFLLIFRNFLNISNEADVEAPAVMKNLKVPFKCKFKSFSSSTTEQFYSTNIPEIFFMNELQWKKYIREVIAHAYFRMPKYSKSDIELIRTSLDICPSLLLDHRDALVMKVTDCFHNIQSLLKAISNATDQITLIEFVTMLRLQLMLYYKEHASVNELPAELSNMIFSLLSKYLQVSPGNASDSKVYVTVLDILHMCVKMSFTQIKQQLKMELRNDSNHGLIIMLKNSELTLDMYYHITDFLKELFSAFENETCNIENVFRMNLFKTIFEVIQQFYISRDFKHIRCLLPLSKTLTKNHLEISEQFFYSCARAFIKLSITARTPTQTGAQFHRDCLLNYIHIFKQISSPLKVISDNILKHFVGLCGHHDMDVRALAWICLSVIANSQASNDISDENLRITGIKFIASKLSYLPGGLIGSCLCTFLDVHEAILVRNFAANLFILLLNETRNFEEVHLLIERQRFFSFAYNSLETCIFDRTFPPHSPLLEKLHNSTKKSAIHLATYDIVINYCRICVAFITLQPDFVKELCEKPLLFKLYEILKVPIMSSNTSYYKMCSQICRLYVLCSKDNFMFLQRTLCHDDRCLSCLFDLLIFPENIRDECIVYVLQLVLILCREGFVFQRLCTRLKKNTEILRNLSNRAITLTHINSPLIRSTLSTLIYLLNKSMADDTSEESKCEFRYALESEIGFFSENSQTVSDDLNTNTNTDRISRCVQSKGKAQKRKLEAAKSNKTTTTDQNGKLSVAEFILIDLLKVFNHMYPCNTCKFDCSPSATRILTCEALSLLLKISPNARSVANDNRLFNKILLILVNFLREFGNNGTTFIKRYGEVKKLAIIKNLKILFQILLHWFSPFAGVLDNELHCSELSKIIIECWPWMDYSLELKLLLLQLCSFLTESSLPVCHQFATYVPLYPHSILQIIIRVVISESQKVKISNIMHLPVVVAGLRVMMNCCACIEGRSVLLKENIVDVIDSLHPFNIKMPKIPLDLLLYWLQFWELFSRYNEGGYPRYLNSLCTVISRFTPCSKPRLLCLKILRNMCFTAPNRNALLTSSDFTNTIYNIIAQPLTSDITEIVSFEEQFIISVAIWQLISGGIKFAATLRSTKLARKLQILHEKLLFLREEDPQEFQKNFSAVDLMKVLEIIADIFNGI